MNKVHYSDQELIQRIRQLAETLGKSPTRLDVDLEENFPRAATFERAFGSFNKALIAAGLEPNGHKRKVPKESAEKLDFQLSMLSNEELLELLKLKAAELDCTPTWAEITLDKRFPSPATIANRFGSYNKALIAAGLEPNQPHERGRNHRTPRFGHQKAPR